MDRKGDRKRREKGKRAEIIDNTAAEGDAQVVASQPTATAIQTAAAVDHVPVSNEKAIRSALSLTPSISSDTETAAAKDSTWTAAGDDGLPAELADLVAEAFLAQSLPSFAEQTRPVEADGIASTIDPTLLLDSTSLGSAENTIGSSSSTSNSIDLSPDSYLLPVNELTLLRGLLRIAVRLGVSQTMWDMNALSPFFKPASAHEAHAPTCNLHLPPNWSPTPSQRSHPHHPFLDFLPWPTTRDRLIGIFALPDDMRPPAACGALALVQLAYDMEDGAEGMRIWGGDPYDAGCWEVGQVLFERWWFIFDRDIVNQSNRWRSLRGAPALKAKASPVHLEQPPNHIAWSPS
jgi:hypothetical protein